jgi:hypothetical protein
VAEATPWPLGPVGGGPATPKGQKKKKNQMGFALGGGRSAPKGHGGGRKPPQIGDWGWFRPPNRPLGVVWPPPVAKAKKKLYFFGLRSWPSEVAGPPPRAKGLFLVFLFIPFPQKPTYYLALLLPKNGLIT